jgi:diguanylate cyclase (GGDEF)-like protein
MEMLDIDIISSLLNQLANLTGFSLSFYGKKGDVIIPPVNENRLLSVIKSSPQGRDEYVEFIKKHLESAICRSNVSIFKGPAGLYHFFVPVRIDHAVFIIVGGGIYLSSDDFKNFYKTECQYYGFLPEQMKSWEKSLIFREYQEVQASAIHIQSIVNLLIRNAYRGGLHEKRYRSIKTILSLISDINLDKEADEIFDILADTTLFLFNVDSVSILTRHNNTFKTQINAGRLKEYLMTKQIQLTGITAEVIEKKIPLYTDSVIDILRIGFDDKITSIHLFPVISENQVTGILCILNSLLSREDAEIISEMCRIAGFIVRIMELQGIYTKCARELGVLNIATERLKPVKEPDLLYETILDTSVHLANAEKGSLMMLENGTSYLMIKAAKGINKKLMSEIRIKAGEGIAGRVFREGIPLVVEDIEKNENILVRKRPKYKTGSFISIPLKVEEQTIGVLNISDKITGEVFSEEDLVLLRSFATYASIALERSNYYSLAGLLKELSNTDSLTGLFNRRYFEERFFEEMQRSTRHNLEFSLAMIDIDDFKLFNDTEGHLAGDEILKNISFIAKECLRVIDVISRFGGEEFAVIMPQTDKNEAFLVAERIRKSVKEQIPRTWAAFPKDHITLTIGISTFPADGEDRKEMIKNADKALYKGKMEGKDRTVLWTI